MAKLVVLRGLPGSGKSTYARDLVDSHGFKRVNKDDLRAMIDNGKYSPENEALIHYIQKLIVREALHIREQNVVVDNTNGDERLVRMWRDMAEDVGAEFEVKVFTTPIETCISRDRMRVRPCGEQVIRDMLNKQFFKELYSA